MGTELHQPYLTFCNPMEIQPVHPKRVQSWVFTGKTDVEAETPILWAPDAKSELTQSKRPWCWERLRAGEGDDRGWNGWMASPTQWTWVWVSSGSWWWTEKPGVLQPMGSQTVGHDWVSELIERQTKYSFMDEWSEVKWKSLSLVWLFVMPWTSPWISLGQNTGVHSLSLLQRIFPTQGLNLGLLHRRQILYHLSHQGSPVKSVTIIMG